MTIILNTVPQFAYELITIIHLAHPHKTDTSISNIISPKKTKKQVTLFAPLFKFHVLIDCKERL